MSLYRPEFVPKLRPSYPKGIASLFVNNMPVVPWNVWDVVKAVGLTVGLALVLIVAFVIAALFVFALASEDTLASFELYGIEAIAYLAAFCVPLASIWFFGIRKYGVSWRTIGFRRTSAAHLLLLVPLVYGVDRGIEEGYTWLVSSLGQEALIPQQEYIEEMFEEAIYKPLLCFDIVVITPIVEEIVFRGFILAGLTLALGNIRGMIISSALFTVVHWDFDIMPIIFVSGMLIAWLYMRTGSLWPPIALHALSNAAATVQYEFFN
ncbi:MAG: CPBP family intramembrane metalloprotease [Chloroflexi bacterium]|nr:CPBP family intramembrane metalloprotease [Chloroflexota bacterium]